MNKVISWKNGDRVQVIFPSGKTGVQTLNGTVLRVREPGPFPGHPERTIRVKFDDPLVLGGLGHAWVDSTAVTEIESL